MPMFTYRAKRSDGDEYEGQVDAQDRFGVYDHVRKEGATIISVDEKVEHERLHEFASALTTFGGGVRMSDKIVLSRNLATMIRAGLSLTRALSVMERQATSRRLRSVLAALERSVAKGSTFHDALSAFPRVFSPLMVSMVRAGEESGKLAEALTVVGNQLEQTYQLRRKIRGALIYPAIIVITMIVVGILMLIYVVPTLTQTFEELGVELPLSTQIIITTSNFLTSNTLLLLGFVAVLLAFAAAFAHTNRGKRIFDFIVLHLPLISPIAKEANAARTARTLSSLLSSGVGVVVAIGITRDVIQNSYYKEILHHAERYVQQGVTLAKAFEENDTKYPALIAEMIAVGEETGQLSPMLEEVAKFYESEVEQKAKDLSTVIEPFLMIVIGIIVGFFALSMITPIYSISGSI